MTKKLFSLLMVLSLMLGVAPVLALEASPAGPPDFEVTSVITPGELSVYAGDPLTLTATTTWTSNKNENQTLKFVSDSWQGVDTALPAHEAELTIEGEPAAQPNDRQRAFISTADLIVSEEPGEYDVVVRYAITLEHDSSGKRTYFTTAETAIITITVMEKPAQEDTEATTPPEGTPLNHGQIVSTWAQWKQTKGNHNFLAGGPGVYRSLVWYKTQVEDRTFYTKQEVIDYLESIYEPAPRKNGRPNNGNPNPNKGPGNNNGNGNGNGNK